MFILGNNLKFAWNLDYESDTNSLLMGLFYIYSKMKKWTFTEEMSESESLIIDNVYIIGWDKVKNSCGKFWIWILSINVWFKGEHEKDW